MLHNFEGLMTAETMQTMSALTEKLRVRSEELYEQGEYIAVTELRTTADHIDHQVEIAKAGVIL